MRVERPARHVHERSDTEADLIAAQLEDLFALEDEERLILRLMDVWLRPSTRRQRHLHEAVTAGRLFAAGFEPGFEP